MRYVDITFRFPAAITFRQVAVWFRSHRLPHVIEAPQADGDPGEETVRVGIVSTPPEVLPTGRWLLTVRLRLLQARGLKRALKSGEVTLPNGVQIMAWRRVEGDDYRDTEGGDQPVGPAAPNTDMVTWNETVPDGAPRTRLQARIG